MLRVITVDRLPAVLAVIDGRCDAWVCTDCGDEWYDDDPVDVQVPCPDCVDGHPIIEVQVECDACAHGAMDACPLVDCDGDGTRTVRASIQAVPIVRYSAGMERPYIVKMPSPKMGGQNYSLVLPDTGPGESISLHLDPPIPDSGAFAIVATEVSS